AAAYRRNRSSRSVAPPRKKRPWPGWSVGRRAIAAPPRTSSPRMSWSMRCAGGRRPGPVCASISNMYRRRCARGRNGSIRITVRGPVLGRPEAENLGELGGRSDLELIVPAIRRPLVGPPALEDAGVTEAVALQMIVFDLTDALDAQRLPRQVLARAPAALSARHARGAIGQRRPVAPRMRVERVGTQGRQLRGETAADGHRK